MFSSKKLHPVTLLLFPFFLLTFFWQTRFAPFAGYAVYDYLIPFVYLSDLFLLLFICIEFIRSPHRLLSFVQDHKDLCVGFFIFIIGMFVVLPDVVHPLGAWYRTYLFVLFFLSLIWWGMVASRYGIERIMLIITGGLLPLLLLGWVEVIFRRSVGLQIIGEWQFSIASPGIAKTFFMGNEFLRPYSTFPHPNVYGAVAAVFLLYWFIRLLKKESTLPKVFLWALFISVLLSFSRGVWIGCLVALVIPFFKNRHMLHYFFRSEYRYWTVVVVVLFVSFFMYRLMLLDSWDYLSIVRRVGLSSVAIEMWLEHLWFGVGPMQFIVLVDQYWSSTGLSRFVQPVHMIPLLILVEHGIVGVAGLCFAIFSFLRKIASVPLELSGVLIFICTTGLIDHYWWTLHAPSYIVALILGCSLYTIKNNNAYS